MDEQQSDKFLTDVAYELGWGTVNRRLREFQKTMAAKEPLEPLFACLSRREQEWFVAAAACTLARLVRAESQVIKDTIAEN